MKYEVVFFPRLFVCKLSIVVYRPFLCIFEALRYKSVSGSGLHTGRPISHIDLILQCSSADESNMAARKHCEDNSLQKTAQLLRAGPSTYIHI